MSECDKDCSSRVDENNNPRVDENDNPGVDENDNPGVDKMDNSRVYENDNQQRKEKKVNKYIGVFEQYITLDIIKHRKFTEAMAKAMKKAEKAYSIDTEEMIRMLKRHKEKVIMTESKGKYATKPRSLSEFFGQRKINSTDLICADYLDDRYYSTETEKNISKKIIIKDTDKYLK